MLKNKKYRVSSKRKNLYRLTYSVYDFYQDYEGEISKEDYIGIVKDFYDLMFKNTLVDRKISKLPKSLGEFRMKKVKISKNKKPRIDFNKTKLYGKKVYHLNTHSMGFYFKWFWDKKNRSVKNKGLYEFNLSKQNTLKIAKEIFRCNTDPYIKDYDALR